MSDQQYFVMIDGERVEITDPNQIASLEQDFANNAAEQIEYERMEYSRKRAREYPSIYDYIDGVVKGDQTQVDAYIAACQAVKAKYPKPE